MTQNGPNREVELKLRTEPGGLAKLRDSDLIRQHARAAMRKTALVSTYYDTPDHRLAARGLALRVRRDGKRLIQTLKAATGGNGAAHERNEWEIEVETTQPELTAFGDPRVLELTGLVLPDELKPFFETRVRREIALVEWPDERRGAALVEVAFDQGTIEAGGREVPLAEVELELKEGRPEAIFSLAAALREIAPLRLETIDKAQRGYRLATERGPLPRKAPAFELTGSASVEDGLIQILRHGLGHWLANEEPARDGSDPEGVHQLRVALRRLRSALSIFKDVLPPRAARGWADEFRWLLQGLGPARDLDVLLTERLPALSDNAELTTRLEALREAARDGRDVAYVRVRETLASPRYADLGLAFAAWIERCGWRDGVDVDILLAQRGPLLGFARAMLDRRWRQVRKRGRHFADLSPEARHKVRIALKKLRYGLDYFGPLFDAKDVKPFGRHMAALQDELGHANDVAVGRHLVTDLVASLAPGPARDAAMLGAGTLIGWQAAGLARIEPELVERWAEFRASKPFWRGRGA